MLRIIFLTFVWPFAYLAVAILLALAYRRRTRPGYAPLWAQALVVVIAAVFTAVGLTRVLLGRALP